MSKQINDGGPAFPTEHDTIKTKDGFREVPSTGMALRDWFAGMAMQGFNANPSIDFASIDMAAAAYTDADAMIKARNQ